MTSEEGVLNPQLDDSDAEHGDEPAGHENMSETEPLLPHSPTMKVTNIIRNITIEPTMFLYMMAFMLTTVIEQALFVNKACRVNHGFNETICAKLHLKEYKEYNKIVQVTVSNFHQWNDIAGHIVPIILAFFMGAWSDKRGRKWPLILGLIGKFYYSVMIVVNATQPSWPVEYIITTATLPSAFTGADVAIFAAAFSYISDISTRENRTLRVTILDVVYLSTMPTGIALGSVLFTKVVNRSYAIMFGINATLLFISLLYTFIRMEWRTTERQRPWRDADNMFTDFFDYKHVVESVKVIVKRRVLHKRAFLSIFIVMMGLYTFQRDEKPMAYLYAQLVFEWTVETFSAYKTFQSAFQVVAMLIGIPIMSKVFGWSDAVIIMVGALAHAFARVFFITAQVPWVFFVGGAFSALGPVVAPALRSMTSKVIPITERGKMFSLLSVADNSIPLIAGPCYSQIYNATLNNFPAAIFYLTMSTQLAVFVLVIFVYFLSRDGTLTVNEDQESENAVTS